MVAAVAVDIMQVRGGGAAADILIATQRGVLVSGQLQLATGPGVGAGAGGGWRVHVSGVACLAGEVFSSAVLQGGVCWLGARDDAVHCIGLRHPRQAN